LSCRTPASARQRRCPAGFRPAPPPRGLLTHARPAAATPCAHTHAARARAHTHTRTFILTPARRGPCRAGDLSLSRPSQCSHARTHVGTQARNGNRCKLPQRGSDDHPQRLITPKTLLEPSDFRAAGRRLHRAAARRQLETGSAAGLVAARRPSSPRRERPV
jgi:hypothetical protein